MLRFRTLTTHMNRHHQIMSTQLAWPLFKLSIGDGLVVELQGVELLEFLPMG